MSSQQEPTIIKDSKEIEQPELSIYAKLCYRVSFIPIIGTILFPLLLIISIVHMGIKFKLGFQLIRRGSIAYCFVNVLFFVPYFFGCFSAFYHCFGLPMNGAFVGYGFEGNKYEANYIFGKIHGKELLYYANGNKHSEVIWNKGQELSSKSWYANGQQMLEEDKVTGEMCYWHENGKVGCRLFSASKLFMKSILWHKNGKKQREGTFSKTYHTRHGIWQYWDESGSLIKEETYDKNGKLISTKEYPTPNQTPSTK